MIILSSFPYNSEKKAHLVLFATNFTSYALNTLLSTHYSWLAQDCLIQNPTLLSIFNGDSSLAPAHLFARTLLTLILKTKSSIISVTEGLTCLKQIPFSLASYKTAKGTVYC